jgi:hypothetical protein
MYTGCTYSAASQGSKYKKVCHLIWMIKEECVQNWYWLNKYCNTKEYMSTQMNNFKQSYEMSIQYDAN